MTIDDVFAIRNRTWALRDAHTQSLRDVKDLLASAKTWLINQDTNSDRRALDDLTLAMQLLINTLEQPT